MHKIVTPILILMFGLLACSPPTVEDIGEKYLKNIDAYRDLKEMIAADTDTKECFTVGTDSIGDYWESSGVWSHSKHYQKKLNIADVLNRVGLTQERYRKYLELFKQAGAERVNHCPDSKRWGAWVRVLVYRSGLAVSGCGGTVEWFERNPPLPTGSRSKGGFTEVKELSNGWYSIVDCI